MIGLLSACGAKNDGDASAAEVNALAKGVAQFEERTFEVDSGPAGKHTYRIAVPRDWTGSGGELRPKQPRDGSRTKLGVAAWCTPPMTGDVKADVELAGKPCTAKDWGLVAAAHVKEQKAIALKVIRDDAASDRHTLITEIGGAAFPEPATLVQVYRWKPSSTVYFLCSATLDGSMQAIAPAFEKACLNASLE